MSVAEILFFVKMFGCVVECISSVWINLKKKNKTLKDDK